MNAVIKETVVEVAINAPRDRVWHAMLNEMSLWWPKDCLALDGAEKMEFEPWAGGRQFVTNAQGHQILWGQVLMIIPQETIDIVGYTMPQYGGPSTWMWRMAVADGAEGGTNFSLTNSIVGRADEESIGGTIEGWTAIFAGLKEYCEA